MSIDGMKNKSSGSSPFFKHWLCGYVTFLQGADTNPVLSSHPTHPDRVERFLLVCLDTSHDTLLAQLWANLVDTNSAPDAVCAVDSAKAGAASRWMPLSKWGDWYRHIMHSACQLVRCAACAQALILSVWLTRPSCPSISGFVALHGCARSALSVYILTSTSQRWQLSFQGV